MIPVSYPPTKSNYSLRCAKCSKLLAIVINKIDVLCLRIASISTTLLNMVATSHTPTDLSSFIVYTNVQYLSAIAEVMPNTAPTRYAFQLADTVTSMKSRSDSFRLAPSHQTFKVTPGQFWNPPGIYQPNVKRLEMKTSIYHLSPQINILIHLSAMTFSSFIQVL